MVWRITKKLKTGSKIEDAIPYPTDADALAIIKADWDRGLIQCASIQDHDYKRVEWPEIKKRLRLQ
jgi:hypothetical protein